MVYPLIFFFCDKITTQGRFKEEFVVAMVPGTELMMVKKTWHSSRNTKLCDHIPSIHRKKKEKGERDRDRYRVRQRERQRQRAVG